MRSHLLNISVAFEIEEYIFQIMNEGMFGETGLPGVFIMYELSPIMVKFTEKHRSVS